ncbi:MAG: hypothetical protein JWQ09_389 [Segetibacter sp.]|nr:hypothetical protein [Segetibacter sp.]
MTQRLIIIGLLFLAACGADDVSNGVTHKSIGTLKKANQISNEWVFDRVDSSRLVFKNEKVFDTHLYGLKYTGQITAKEKAPFLIFSGRDCDECDANISIYIHSPSDGQLAVDYGQNRYQYPGTEKDFETDSLLYVARAFYGQVLDNTKGVIWYESRLLENGKMGRGIFLVQIKNGTLKDTSYNDSGSLDKTITLMKKGLCKEIKGQDFTSEP